jgi:uncharacterized protein YheU (UPF0270 family)
MAVFSMAQFIQVPVERLSSDVLAALLEEFASRDGTDYGDYDLTLAAKVNKLRGQLGAGSLCLLYDADSEQWDLVSHDKAQELLA